MMKRASILWGVAFGISFGAACVFGQQRPIQPSPAYYPSGGATYNPQAPAAQPQTGAPGAQPIYYAPQPMSPVQYVPHSYLYFSVCGALHFGQVVIPHPCRSRGRYSLISVSPCSSLSLSDGSRSGST